MTILQKSSSVMPSQAITSRQSRVAPRRVSSTVWVWLGLLGFWVLGKLMLALFFPAINVSQIASEFNWGNIAVLGLLSLLGAYLSTKEGFPDALDPAISNRKRILIPLLVGLGFALVEISLELAFHGTKLLSAKLGGVFNVDYPASLVVYTSGTTMIESFLHVIPLPILMFLISNVILRKKGQSATFWALAALVALIEPLTQQVSVAVGLGASLPPNWPLLIIPVAVEVFLMNLTQLAAFRRYGLLACYLIRLAEYAAYHIAFMNFIAPLLHY